MCVYLLSIYVAALASTERITGKTGVEYSSHPGHGDCVAVCIALSKKLLIGSCHCVDEQFFLLNLARDLHRSTLIIACDIFVQRVVAVDVLFELKHKRFLSFCEESEDTILQKMPFSNFFDVADKRHFKVVVGVIR